MSFSPRSSVVLRSSALKKRVKNVQTPEPAFQAGGPRWKAGPQADSPPHNPRRTAGVTLIELLIVMAIIGLMAGVSFPAISSGLDSVKLTSASDSVAAFLNGALNRAERHQQPVALTVDPKANKLEIYSNEPGFRRELPMPEGVTIEAVLPRIPEQPDSEPRHVIVMPGGTPPAIGIQLLNRRGHRRIVRVDPMTGFPRIEGVPAK